MTFAIFSFILFYFIHKNLHLTQNNLFVHLSLVTIKMNSKLSALFNSKRYKDQISL